MKILHKIPAILWMIFVLIAVFQKTEAASDKVKLTDVSALTLYNGKMTTGRRSSPTLQLKCVGGSAKGAFKPKIVQCVNQGHDGFDVQWRCDADLPHDIEFGRINVNCEGYSYPEDSYILRGSCGLEYELEYTSGSEGKSVYKNLNEQKWDTFATFVVIAFIVYVVYAMYSNRNQGANNTGYSSPGSGPGGPGSGPGAPPPYDDNFGKPPPYGFRSQPQHPTGSSGTGGCGANENQGGGFWTGAGLGALGGYLASNYFTGGYARPRNRGFFRDTGFTTSSDQFFSGPSTSTSTRSSSGYGGTSRR